VSLRRILLGACALLVALVVAAPAQADRAFNATISFPDGNVNCVTGEPIVYTSTWHFVGKTEFISDELGEITTMQHVNSQDTQGVGVTSGDHYVIQTTILGNDHAFNAADPTRLIGRFHIIDTGSGADWYVSAVYHTTINANGELTVAKESGNVRCGDLHEHVNVDLS
jgi:hypothetical protein